MNCPNCFEGTMIATEPASEEGQQACACEACGYSMIVHEGDVPAFQPQGQGG